MKLYNKMLLVSLGAWSPGASATPETVPLLSKIITQGAETIRTGREYLGVAKETVGVARQGLSSAIEYYTLYKDAQEALSDGLQLEDLGLIAGKHNAWLIQDIVEALEAGDNESLHRKLRRYHRLTRSSYDLVLNLEESTQRLADRTRNLELKVAGTRNKDVPKATLEIATYLLKIEMKQLEAISRAQTLAAYEQAERLREARRWVSLEQDLSQVISKSRVRYKGTIIQ